MTLTDRASRVSAALIDAPGELLAGLVDRATDLLDTGTRGGASAALAAADRAVMVLIDRAAGGSGEVNGLRSGSARPEDH